MVSLNVMLSLLFLSPYSIKSQSPSVYPCIWKDKMTNARLDLQLFKNATLTAQDENITIYYTPCANGLIIDDKPTMIYIENRAKKTEQNLAVWDDGVIAPNHAYNQWNFVYSSSQIKCASGASQTEINISWECVGGTVLTPYIFEIVYDISNLCKIQMTIFSAIACVTGTADDCTFYDSDSNNKLDLSIYNDSIIKANIDYPIDSANSFRYSPCVASLICNNYTVLASEVSDKSGQCNHSLALYTPYMNSVYGTTGYDSLNQVWSLQYYSGDTCDNGNINRLFDVAWQCDTTVYPSLYAVSDDTSEITECVDQLSINSSYACLGFVPCMYVAIDGAMNAQLNLTNIFPTLLAVQYSNMQDIYLLYSPCQLALNANNSSQFQTEAINSLYNAGDAIIGEYTRSVVNGSFMYQSTGVYSGNYMTQPTYNGEDKTWEFVYNDNSMPYKFVVTWQCGSSSEPTWYAIKSPDLSQLIVYSKDVC